jgi:hypothetical protein
LKNVKGGGEEEEMGYSAEPKAQPQLKEDVMEKLAALTSWVFFLRHLQSETRLGASLDRETWP